MPSERRLLGGGDVGGTVGSDREGFNDIDERAVSCFEHPVFTDPSDNASEISSLSKVLPLDTFKLFCPLLGGGNFGG